MAEVVAGMRKVVFFTRDFRSVVDLLFEPGRDFLDPARGVFAQTGTAEVNPFAVRLAQVTFERI